MNVKHSKELLAETLCDEGFERHDLQTQRAALREFRKRQWKKKLAGIARIAAVLAAAGISLFFLWKPKQPQKEVVSSAASPTGKLLPARPRAEQSGLMNDEQLLAVFPPGSCYLAEVNGRKMLVFRDEKVKQRFFN